ncbi:M48 family metallopeptidase [Deinococcus apachensis]|uniref:M48 family metallopeptidase n=1 Tax=Deinococcus apachensis TaxID=309886 RepID=UPI0012F710F6|nr:SprT family zinc-dependent metalloprotease [Deinococcus apachensis]
MSTPTRPRSQPGWMVGGVPVQLKRSARRRTVTLRVQPGAVTVHAPTRTPLDLIQAFVEAKRGWAEGHLARYAAQAVAPTPLADGSPLPFFGETLVLRPRPGTRAPLRLGSELHVPPGDPDTLARAVEAWYRRAALPELRTLTEGYADALGARDRLGQVRLSRAHTRWGSCTAGGDIRLHWALARAPREVAAYVALHEAAHLLEFNHSPRYWAHVSRLMPDHAHQRAWLKEHGQTLARL